MPEMYTSVEMDTVIFGLVHKNKALKGTVKAGIDEKVELVNLNNNWEKEASKDPSGYVAHVIQDEDRSIAFLRTVGQFGVKEPLPGLSGPYGILTQYKKYHDDLLKMGQKIPKTLCIPYVKAGRPLGEDHMTFLTITLDDKNEVKNINLYDPKGPLPKGIFFSTKDIETAVNETFPRQDKEKVKVQEHFLGVQGIFDSTSCGPITVSLFNDVLNGSIENNNKVKLGHQLEERVTSNNFFQNIWMFFFGISNKIVNTLRSDHHTICNTIKELSDDTNTENKNLNIKNPKQITKALLNSSDQTYQDKPSKIVDDWRVINDQDQTQSNEENNKNKDNSPIISKTIDDWEIITDQIQFNEDKTENINNLNVPSFR